MTSNYIIPGLVEFIGAEEGQVAGGGTGYLEEGFSKGVCSLYSIVK